jgi:O-antigen/teichoic acid export membrane protein
VIAAVNQWAYVIAAYAIVVGTLVAYVARTIALGRRAGRRLPPEQRRWM